MWHSIHSWPVCAAAAAVSSTAGALCTFYYCEMGANVTQEHQQQMTADGMPLMMLLKAV
jgi:hypothetical protein